MKRKTNMDKIKTYEQMTPEEREARNRAAFY
jgi:hypothetical protein